MAKVVAGYHRYGYWLESFESGKAQREYFGNAIFDSTSVITLDDRNAVPLGRLKQYADTAAKCLARRLRLEEQHVNVFHDVDTEYHMRVKLQDETTQACC